MDVGDVTDTVTVDEVDFSDIEVTYLIVLFM